MTKILLCLLLVAWVTSYRANLEYIHDYDEYETLAKAKPTSVPKEEIMCKATYGSSYKYDAMLQRCTAPAVCPNAFPTYDSASQSCTAPASCPEWEVFFWTSSGCSTYPIDGYCPDGMTMDERGLGGCSTRPTGTGFSCPYGTWFDHTVLLCRCNIKCGSSRKPGASSYNSYYKTTQYTTHCLIKEAGFCNSGTYQTGNVCAVPIRCPGSQTLVPGAALCSAPVM